MGLPRRYSVRSLVEAKERKATLQCDELHVGLRTKKGRPCLCPCPPRSPIVARLVRGADVPPQAARSSRETVHAGRGHEHVRMCSIPSALSSAYGVVPPGSWSGRSAGRHRAGVSSRVIRTGSRSRLRARSVACAVCSRPPSGRGAGIADGPLPRRRTGRVKGERESEVREIGVQSDGAAVSTLVPSRLNSPSRGHAIPSSFFLFPFYCPYDRWLDEVVSV